jgi:hypothetical protein
MDAAADTIAVESVAIIGKNVRFSARLGGFGANVPVCPFMSLAPDELMAHSPDTIYAKEASFETFHRGYGI